MKPRKDRLTDARLYLCTDGRGGGKALAAFLEDVLLGGVDIVQLREKNADARTQLQYAKVFRGACDRHGALFIMNDRVDLAIAAQADGVHLGQDDLAPRHARGLAGTDFIIGRSTHSREDIESSETEPIDYIAIGPVYETPTKPGRPAVGLGLIEHAARTATRPWFAIGGIDQTNVDAVTRSGASRIVVVRALTQASNATKAARALREALEHVHV